LIDQENDLEYDVETPEPDPLDPFFADGRLVEVLHTLKSGKEGTVYCCRASPSTGFDLLAAKVYRPRNHRSFKNDAIYREGRVILNQRNARAVKNKSDWGREVSFGSWIFHEFETLQQLHASGAAVPAPVAMAETAILMEYFGDEDEAAPMLSSVRLEPDEVRPLFAKLMFNIELLLSQNHIHGDLSPFNILYWNGDVTIIDFPQSVDPRVNPQAFQLLGRDIDRVCAYFARYGLKSDPPRITEFLWGKFFRAEL